MFGKPVGKLGAVGGRTLIQRAISVLRRFGQDAHIYLPGVGMLNGLQAGNYLDSALTTPAAIDNPVGGVVDAMGGINATQPTTSAKPILRRDAGGRYYWQFDGSNDSLSLGSVPFQMSDDHWVVAVAMTTNQVGNQRILSMSGTVSRSPVLLFTGGGVSALYVDDAGTVGSITGPAVAAGTPIVAAVKKIGNAKTLRVNGVQVGSNSTALGTAAVDFSLIGASSAGAYLNGNIYHIAFGKGTMTDADLLLIEKMLGQIAGVQI